LIDSWNSLLHLLTKLEGNYSIVLVSMDKEEKRKTPVYRRMDWSTSIEIK